MIFSSPGLIWAFQSGRVLWSLPEDCLLAPLVRSFLARTGEEAHKARAVYDEGYHHTSPAAVGLPFAGAAPAVGLDTAGGASP